MESALNSNLNACVDQAFLSDVFEGFSRSQKSLPCKYFYDERGSQLFDQICELDEYYLTRCEQAIMNQYVGEMAFQLGERVMLVEFGSGSSTKTRVLLENLIEPAAYVPLDISEEHLLNTADVLRKRFPEIEILPLVADFTKPFVLPQSKIKPSHCAVYFPGSTIGNFPPDHALRLLQKIAGMLGPEGGLLIGIDLQKDPDVIWDAYNDSSGITDEFNLNLLCRINRELDANIKVDNFEHLAIYNELLGRVEIYLVSCCEQVVEVKNRRFKFAKGERIFTEYSHKYTVDGFSEMAAKSGFELHKYWTDADELFAVLHLVLPNDTINEGSNS
jgi:dimethylhistidine N-methyltransferase